MPLSDDASLAGDASPTGAVRVSSAAGSVAGFELRVPGSISNLGPGFDSLAVAVQIYLDLRVTEVRPDAPDTIETHFADGGPPGENRIETAFRHARARVGTPAPGVRIEARSDIPTRAGLGSSGAATLAGLQLYRAAHRAHRRPQICSRWRRTLKATPTTRPLRSWAG